MQENNNTPGSHLTEEEETFMKGFRTVLAELEARDSAQPKASSNAEAEAVVSAKKSGALKKEVLKALLATGLLVGAGYGANAMFGNDQGARAKDAQEEVDNEQYPGDWQSLHEDLRKNGLKMEFGDNRSLIGVSTLTRNLDGTYEIRPIEDRTQHIYVRETEGSKAGHSAPSYRINPTKRVFLAIQHDSNDGQDDMFNFKTSFWIEER